MKWEYKVVWTGCLKPFSMGADNAGNVEKMLNEAGAEGWEMCAREDEYAYMKRPAKEDEKA